HAPPPPLPPPHRPRHPALLPRGPPGRGPGGADRRLDLGRAPGRRPPPGVRGVGARGGGLRQTRSPHTRRCCTCRQPGSSVTVIVTSPCSHPDAATRSCSWAGVVEFT